MKYIVVDDNTTAGGFIETEVFESFDEAEKRANILWNHLTSREKSNRDAFYIAETIHSEDAFNFDEIIIDYKKEFNND